MSRPRAETLTGREAQIMDAVWRLGEATAEQVREALPEPLHDSTVRTVLRVLESKGYLGHEVRGKAYVYRAAVERTKAQRHALRSVLARFFGGSAEDLVLRLIEDERITPEQLDALRDKTSARRGQGVARRRPGSKGTGA
jgi:BlaI family transcriptional regulator, penicillinase repressor